QAAGLLPCRVRARSVEGIMPTQTLDPTFRELLRGRCIATLGTENAEGTIHLTAPIRSEYYSRRCFLWISVANYKVLEQIGLILPNALQDFPNLASKLGCSRPVKAIMSVVLRVASRWV